MNGQELIKEQPIIEFSVVTKNKGPLTKIVGLKDGEFYKDGGECKMSRGSIEKKQAPLSEFPKIIRMLDTNQAIAHGTHKHGDVKLVNKDAYTGAEGTGTRSKNQMAYPSGPGVGLLDHDKPRDNAVGSEKALKAYSRAELLTVMEELDQEFKTSHIVSTPSTSSCIYDKDGNELRGEGTGSHNYYYPKDALLIPDYLERLGEHAWLKGYGRYEISRSGGRLPRTIIDLMVGSPERLDFVAGAVCKNGLTQKLPEPTVREGTLHDCSKLHALTDEEKRKVKGAQEKLKADIADAVDEVKAKYKGEEVNKLVDTGMDTETAERVVRSRLSQLLHDSDVLYLADGTKLTAKELLDNGKKHDRKTLGDPLEPEYDNGSKTKAKFYWNGGNAKINSFAHGKHTYKFCRLEGIFDWENDLEILLKKAANDAGAMYENDSLWFLQNLMKAKMPIYVRNKVKIKIIVGGLAEFEKVAKKFERPIDESRRETYEENTAQGHPPGELEATKEGKHGRPERTGKLLIVSKGKDVVIGLLAQDYCIHPDSPVLFKFESTHWEKVKGEDPISQAVIEIADREAGVTGYSASYLSGLVSLTVKSGKLKGTPVKEGVIPFQNGMLDVRTLELSPTTKDNATSYCTPHLYDPDALCEKWLKWLSWALEEDPISIHLVQAFICLTLIGKTVSKLRSQKYLELVGRGGTGKSTFVRILMSLMGPDSVGSTTFDAIQKNTHETASLVGKSLILFSEGSWQGKIDVFKSITGGDPIPINIKHIQTDNSVTLMGQVIVVANSFVKTSDSSNALKRRRVPLKFDKEPTEDEKEKWGEAGGEAAVMAEGPGIIKWALELSEGNALKILADQTSERIESYKLEAEKDDKPLVNWMMDTLILLGGNVLQVGNAEKNGAYNDGRYHNEDDWLYPNYCKWCDDNKYKPTASRSFTKELLNAARTYEYDGVRVVQKRVHNKSGIEGLAFYSKKYYTWSEEMALSESGDGKP